MSLPLLNVPSSVPNVEPRCRSRHIVIWCRFALVISNLLKWQRKLHNPKSLSLHTNTDACTPLILYSPTACNSMSMCAHVSPTSESQMHPSQHLHGATRTPTPGSKRGEGTTHKRELMGTLGERSKSGRRPDFYRTLCCPLCSCGGAIGFL